MSDDFDFGPVDRITAGAVGEPGGRTFFVQARRGAVQITLLTEKEQVRILAAALQQILDELPEVNEDPPPADADLELVEPLEPVWRVGEMSVEYDEIADQVKVVLREFIADDQVREPASFVFTATRAQVRAMSSHAAEVVDAGRPRCQLCGYPMDVVTGIHVCPAMNGHRSYRDD